MFRLVTTLVLFALISCGEPSYIPKPRLYPKVDYPQKTYRDFITDYCQFSFDMPSYAEVIQDEKFFDEKPADPCWFDLNIPTLNGRIHCSYIPLKNRAHFDEMIDDAFNLVSKHNIKANYREEELVSMPTKKVYGMIFEIDGPVASPLQFYLTDSTTHYMRGSLYFNSKVDQDSIAPVYQFVKADVIRMIETFYWK